MITHGLRGTQNLLCALCSCTDLFAQTITKTFNKKNISEKKKCNEFLMKRDLMDSAYNRYWKHYSQKFCILSVYKKMLDSTIIIQYTYTYTHACI